MVLWCVMEKFSLRLVSKGLRFFILLLLLPIAHVDALRSHTLTKEHKHRKVQSWSSFCLAILGKKCTVHHQQQSEHLSHTLIVCNHQGLIDPLPIVCAIQSPLSFVSKIENKKILGIGEWGKVIDLIYFDRDSREGNVKMLRECTQQLKAGGNVLIFPEGTRSKSDAMKPFKAKAFGIVKMAKANVLPITLSHAYDPFNPKIKDPLTITIHPLMPYESLKDMDVETLSDTLYDIISSAIQPTTLHT